MHHRNTRSLGFVFVSFATLILFIAAPRVGAQGPLNWNTQQDHADMLKQLGITKLRPGRNSREGTTNAANYDEARANPFPDLPDALTLRNGQKVTSAEL